MLRVYIHNTNTHTCPYIQFFRPCDEGMCWRGMVCVMPANKVPDLLEGVLELVGDEAYRNQIKD